MSDVSAPPSPRLAPALAAAALLCLATAAPVCAQDTWVSVTTPNFTVLSNGGERSAKRIAVQFERVKLAIVSAWPWARVQLDRPVTVLAAKDEKTMKMLAPEYWEPGSQIKPVSVFATGTDYYFIALRADVEGNDTPDENPYQPAYWSYASLLLNKAFDPPLPLWLRNGLAGVLSNSIVRDSWVEFGRPLSAYVRTFNGQPRQTLAALMTTTAGSSYYTNSIERSRFDSQSWATVHYLLYGRPDANARALDNIVSQVLAGKTSANAVQSEFGDVGSLDSAISRYVQNGLFKYERVEASSAVDERSLSSMKVPSMQVRAARLGFHVAMRNVTAARALIAESVKEMPNAAAWLDAEGVLLDREGKSDEARQAYTKAVLLGSTSAFTLYRAASFQRAPANDTDAIANREALLKSAIAANSRMAVAHALLADTYSSAGRHDEALTSARMAVSIDARSAYSRLALARALWNSGQRDDARGHALAARTLADNEGERSAVQAMLDFFDRASRPPSTAATASPAAASPAASSAAPAPAAPAAAPAATATARTEGAAPPSSRPRMLLNLRTVGPDETRVLGMFQAIECRDARIVLVADVAGQVMRFGAQGFTDVNFTSFRSDTPAAVNCSPFPKAFRALLTYRASADQAAGINGLAVAVELVPDDFTPR